jgi:lipoteichoic acid synthase
MTLLLVATKVSYVDMATFWKWATRPQDYFSSIFVEWAAAASHADAIFAVAAGCIAGILLWSSRDRLRLAQVLRTAFIALGLLLLVYAVVSRQVFSYYSAPLTYQLLLLGGEPAKLWSSIEGFITLPSVVALVGLPVGFLLLTGASEWVDRRLGRRARLLVRAAALACALGWVALGHGQSESRWFQAQDRHFRESPHWVFIQSVALAVSNGSSVLGATAYAASEAGDFRPSAGTAGRARAKPQGPSGSRRPNVVLIVLESVGTRYLGIYGSTLDTTPSLRREQGSLLVFDGYYAPVGWTAYALLSLTMSQRPPMERYNELSFRAATLQGASVAEVLATAGYRTAFMAAGDPDWASAGFLERNGFHEVLRGKDLSGAAQVSSWGMEDRFLFERMASWVDDNASEPFFLMAWTDQTHHPYAVAPGQQLVDVLDRERKAANPSLASYTSLIHAVDAQIGRFLGWLRDRGLADDTIVVITGDHGEAFGEPHGGSGHGFSVYDEEVRVPLIFWNPKRFRQAGRRATVGSHIDLAPTILDLAGIDAPAGWDGTSLFDEERTARTYLFAAAWGQYLLGVRSGEWKYVYDARLGKEELYDLRKDPDELRDLSRDEPSRAAELRRRLAAWMQVERQRGELRKQAEGR